MKKLLGFGLTTPLFIGLTVHQQYQQTTGFYIAVGVLTAMALYGLMILDEIYTEERRKAKNEQQN